MIRNLAFLALFLTFTASAQVTSVMKVTDDVDPRATHCGRYENDLFIADFPVVPTATGKRCEFNIINQVAGVTVVYKATAVMQDATWGRTESPRSLPLSVARPSGLTVAPAWALVQPAPASTVPSRFLAPDRSGLSLR